MKSETAIQKPLSDHFKAYFHLVRIPNDIAIALSLMVALVVGGALEQNIPWRAYVLVALAGFLISAHGMVVNDIIDYEIDKINEPSRVLPSGMISRREALIYSVVLGILGIGIAVLIDYYGYFAFRFSWLYAIFHAVLIDLYNWKLKKSGFIGNLVVSYAVFALFFYSDFFMDKDLDMLATGFGVVGFLANTAREVTKGIIDVEGDRAHGVKTIAVLLGTRAAGIISAILLFVSVSLIPFFFLRLGIIGKIGISIFGLGLLIAGLIDLTSPTRKKARIVKYIILYGFLEVLIFLLADSIIRDLNLF